MFIANYYIKLIGRFREESTLTKVLFFSTFILKLI